MLLAMPTLLAMAHSFDARSSPVRQQRALDQRRSASRQVGLSRNAARPARRLYTLLLHRSLLLNEPGWCCRFFTLPPTPSYHLCRSIAPHATFFVRAPTDMASRRLPCSVSRLQSVSPAPRLSSVSPSSRHARTSHLQSTPLSFPSCRCISPPNTLHSHHAANSSRLRRLPKAAPLSHPNRGANMPQQYDTCMYCPRGSALLAKSTSTTLSYASPSHKPCIIPYAKKPGAV
jgi:hypothetical protein